ncbi:PIN domain-containing protein [Mucilaginibacter ximonensis]|uniref:PIN domain-containing protein n=1 Tax=Mucilaginibacter ximonensis TaxID=538021 RepID=A0ABW5YE50_9SPHI
MAYKHLFIDSDVILDMLVDRQPFSIYAEMLLAERKLNGVTLNTSALIIANINYILTKTIGKQGAKDGVKQILKLLEVLPFEKEDIESAINGSFADFEDAIENHIAVKHNAEAIITRNIKDYKQATIPVLTAEQFLRTL